MVNDAGITTESPRLLQMMKKQQKVKVKKSKSKKEMMQNKTISVSSTPC